jgi:putative hydrolase of HD superfamily
MKKKELQSITNFIYETGILAKTPRSGLWFLGTGQQSVAEHTLRTVFIGYLLSKIVPNADMHRIIFLCLMHDLGEGRTSDLNYVHQKYGRLAENQAVEDIAKSLPFGNEIREAYIEEQAKTTLEGKIAKEADTLEWLATMREEEVKGNKKAEVWGRTAYERLKTPAGKQLGKLLLTTHPDAWWFDEKDKWFVNRNPKLRKWNNKK